MIADENARRSCAMICHVSIYMAEQQRSILLEDDWMVINSPQL